LFYEVFITKELHMKRIIRLTESDLTRIVRRVIKESLDGEYNYDDAKDNPRTIVVKFAQGGKNQFWDQHIKSNEPSYKRGLGENWVFFRGWEDLTDSGLEMRDGWYYALYKLYDPRSIKKWEDRGRRGEPEQETYFLNYSKEAGEISIFSSMDYSLDVGFAKRHEFSELNPNSISHTYCRLEGPNGESRLATTGSRDHRGYFKIVDTKN
jgi:hypothetical protein